MEQHVEGRTEEQLQEIQAWANRGTLRQFYTEVSAVIPAEGYRLELQADELVCYRVRKEGGFLGIGARTVKEPVLRFIREDGQIVVADEPVDEEFVRLLASSLTKH